MTDVQQRLQELRTFADETLARLDALSREQQELLKVALDRIRLEEIEAVRRELSS